MPHPEPYSGEADLERFEVFVAALLPWLSLNLLLGSDRASTLTQVRYLGNCLKAMPRSGTFGTLNTTIG